MPRRSRRSLATSWPRSSSATISASKTWNLAGLKCAAVVTASPAMAPLAARFPPDARWRIGHLGVIAAVAAYNEGEVWLDQLLRTLDHRRLVLGTFWPSGCRPFAASRPALSSWPGWTAAASGPIMRPASCSCGTGGGPCTRTQVRGPRSWLRPPQLRHQRRHPRPGDQGHGPSDRRLTTARHDTGRSDRCVGTTDPFGKNKIFIPNGPWLRTSVTTTDEEWTIAMVE
jgi:hypothetical protein